MTGSQFEVHDGIQDGTGFMVGVQRVQVDIQAGQDLVELVPVVDAGIDLPPFAVGPVGRHGQHEHFAARDEVDGQVHFLDAHARIAAAQQHDGVVVPGVPFHHGGVIRPVVDVEPRFRERADHPGVLFRIGHGVVDDEQAGTGVLACRTDVSCRALDSCRGRSCRRGHLLPPDTSCRPDTSCDAFEA